MKFPSRRELFHAQHPVLHKMLAHILKEISCAVSLRCLVNHLSQMVFAFEFDLLAIPVFIPGTQ